MCCTYFLILLHGAGQAPCHSMSLDHHGICMPWPWLEGHDGRFARPKERRVPQGRNLLSDFWCRPICVLDRGNKVWDENFNLPKVPILGCMGCKKIHQT